MSDPVSDLLEPEFAVTAVTRDGTRVVSVSGELDMATAPALRAVLSDRDDDTPVVVDLCDVAFMDSSGLSALISARRDFAARDVPFAVACNPDGTPMRTMTLTGVTALLKVEHSVESALRAVAASAARD